MTVVIDGVEKTYGAFALGGLDAAYPVAIVLVVVSALALLVLDTVASNPWR